MFRHILTATDGSDWALKGVKVAIDMAAAMKARLTILSVTEPYPDYVHAEGFIAVPDVERIRQSAALKAAEILDSVSALARAQNVDPSAVYVDDAHAATAITEKAQELGCDLIVIGSRGRRGLTKLILGSQAAEVLAGTQLPVLIVK